MIFRLTYYNSYGNLAKLEIETPTGTGVQVIEGAGDPFQLKYRTEKTDKSGYFMTSTAEINILANELFNIDNLKTSSETDIKVTYYISGLLKWQGFVIPDFFATELGTRPVVSMVASDRINTLKSVRINNLPENIALRVLAQQCLDQTGLGLTLLTMADFRDDDDTLLFNTYIQTQRLINEKGRSTTCYDILKSILIISNSYLVQRNGFWQIINKYQLERGVGMNYSTFGIYEDWIKTEHNFDFVNKGAIREIVPVASKVGVLQKYGGGKIYPKSHNFSNSSIWTIKNDFYFTRYNQKIEYFSKVGDNYTIKYDGIPTDIYHIINRSKLNRSGTNFIDTQPYLKSAEAEMVFNFNRVEIEVELSAFAPSDGVPSLVCAIIAEKGSKRLILNKNGQFVNLTHSSDNLIEMRIPTILVGTPEIPVVSHTSKFKGILDVGDDLVSDYKIHMRIFGTGASSPIVGVYFAKFSVKIEGEVGKGTLFETKQGSNFTKIHEDDETLFGDFLNQGVNGYFYSYQSDDLSSLVKSDGTNTSAWTSNFDLDNLGQPFKMPILQLITRQKSRMFSIAHDIIRADIEVRDFDPLAIFKDCNGVEYVMVSAEFDFLRSVVKAEIEQIDYDEQIERRDYIYSEFGNNDK